MQPKQAGRKQKPRFEGGGNISFRLPADLMQAVEKIAAEERRKNSEIGRFALEEYVERRKRQAA